MSVKPRIPIVFETKEQRDNRQLDRDVIWSIVIAVSIVVLAVATKLTQVPR